MNPQDTAVSDLTHTVHVAIKESDGNYGSTERGMFVQFSTPRDVSFDDVLRAGRARMRALEADLRGEAIDTSEIETATPPPTPPPVPETTTAPPAETVDPASVFPGAVEVPASNDPDPIANFDPQQFAQFALSLGVGSNDFKAALARRWTSHPGEFWDNSQDKRHPKAPDYKWGKGDSEGALKSLDKDTAFKFALWKTDLAA